MTGAPAADTTDRLEPVGVQVHGNGACVVPVAFSEEALEVWAGDGVVVRGRLRLRPADDGVNALHVERAVLPPTLTCTLVNDLPEDTKCVGRWRYRVRGADGNALALSDGYWPNPDDAVAAACAAFGATMQGPFAIEEPVRLAQPPSPDHLYGAGQSEAVTTTDWPT